MRPGVPAQGEPALEERRRGCDDEQRQAGPDDQDREEPEGRGQAPGARRLKVGRDRDRQDHERRAQEEEMNRELPAGIPCRSNRGGRRRIRPARLPGRTPGRCSRPPGFHPGRAGPSCRPWAGPRRARRPPGTSRSRITRPRPASSRERIGIKANEFDARRRFRLVDLDRSSTISGKGREASGALVPPRFRAAPSREDIALSLHRRIGSRLRFQEYLRAYRDRIKGPKADRARVRTRRLETWIGRAAAGRTVPWPLASTDRCRCSTGSCTGS